MIGLIELRALCAPAFPGTEPTLVPLLVAWARQDPTGELANALRGTGIDNAGVDCALAPLLGQPDAADAELMMQCIMTDMSDPPTGHRLLRLLARTPTHRVSRALVAQGLDLSTLEARLQATVEPAALVAGRQTSLDQDLQPILRYGRDLTALAAEGAFDALCDRPEEIVRLFDVLQRMTKGNPVLTGDPGVGKTALAELFARCLITGDVPAPLQGMRLYEVSITRLLAGTHYRGDFEDRLEKLLQTAIRNQPAALFIDELHLIWGAGRAEGVIQDAANALKPYLARGVPRVIGATTSQEYHHWITQDPALERRFEEVLLAPPEPRLTWNMVARQAEALARFHGVDISSETITQAIALTDQHLRQYRQPDKSVGLLDGAAVLSIRAGRKTLIRDDLLQTLSRKTGRPVETLDQEGRQELRTLPDRLRRRVIGQDVAIDELCRVLQQRRQEIGTPARNFGTFLFAGETGIGKTHLAQVLAQEFFHDEGALLQLDLSEYSEPHAVARLLGSPPGYEGGERQGLLFEWYHSHKRGIILLDELEKSHNNVRVLWLAAMDENRVTDARGRTIDLSQCVIIFTTNAVRRAELRRQSIGFMETAPPDAEELLLEHFPPEFLGRLDARILFRPLGSEAIRAILKLRIDEAMDHLRGRGHTVRYDEERLLAHLLGSLRRMNGGARDIARLIEQQLLQPISLVLLYRDREGPAAIELGENYYRDGEVSLCESTEVAYERNAH